MYDRIGYVTVKNTGSKPLSLFVGDTEKYSLKEGDETQVDPAADGYTVKAGVTTIATIQYPSFESFQVIKGDTLTDAKFSTTVELSMDPPSPKDIP